MTTLSAVYFEFDFTLSEEEKLAAKSYYENFIRDISTNLYHQETDVHVELVDGSLKFWLSIAGALYLAIGQYGAFRTGINQIIDDAKTIKRILLSDLKKNGIVNEQIKIQKKLYVTPDRIRRILLRIDRLEENKKGLNEKQKKKEIESIFRSVERLSYELDSKKDFDLFISSLKENYILSNYHLPILEKRNIYIRREEDLLSLPPKTTDTSLVLHTPYSNQIENKYINLTKDRKNKGFSPWFKKNHE